MKFTLYGMTSGCTVLGALVGVLCSVLCKSVDLLLHRPSCECDAATLRLVVWMLVHVVEYYMICRILHDLEL
jgi:hypothetical protein